MRRWVQFAALLVLVFGLLCLNYTADAGADHHREWAREHGAPAPNAAIFYAGAAVTTLSAGLLGFLLGRPRRRA